MSRPQGLRLIQQGPKTQMIVVKDKALILYEGAENEIAATTEDSRVRFLLVSGKPLGEPVAWYGPIAMNTREKLRIAFEGYQNGTFIKYRKT